MQYKIGGKTIGSYDEGTKTFIKHVNRRKHLLRIMDAWGIQSTVVHSLSDRGCIALRIVDKADGIIYELPLQEFLAHAVERDFGDGKQLFVSRKFFKQYAIANNQRIPTSEAGSTRGNGSRERDAVSQPEAGNHPTLFG